MDVTTSHGVRAVVRMSFDLLGTLAVAALALLGILTTTGPIRTVFALPLLLFLPGYAVVSALFPASLDGASPPVWDRADGTRGLVRRGAHVPITVGERAALAFGFSLTLLPVLMFVILVFGGAASDGAILAESLMLVTVGGVLVSLYRRQQFPADERFEPPFGRWFSEFSEALYGSGSRVDTLLTVGAVVAIVFTMALLTYAVVVPQNGEAYTEFSVLTESSSGELVASGYPTELAPGESTEVILTVTNYEGSTVGYTVVGELQRVQTSGTELTVLERQSVSRETPRLAEGETWRAPQQVTPELRGTDLRLVFYLYVGDAPATPSTETAEEYLQLWIDVTEDA